MRAYSPNLVCNSRLDLVVGVHSLRRNAAMFIVVQTFTVCRLHTLFTIVQRSLVSSLCPRNRHLINRRHLAFNSTCYQCNILEQCLWPHCRLRLSGLMWQVLRPSCQVPHFRRSVNITHLTFRVLICHNCTCGLASGKQKSDAGVSSEQPCGRRDLAKSYALGAH